jgi:hypothetical protein
MTGVGLALPRIGPHVDVDVIRDEYASVLFPLELMTAAAT